tara:strand:- start:10753 stop:10983 length:231 start_codon:yes stop_codon:yes gene_type:complete
VVDIAVWGEGLRARRRFFESDSVAVVEAWVGRVLGLDMRQNQLWTGLLRITLEDGTLTLREAGIKDKHAMAVTPRR